VAEGGCFEGDASDPGFILFWGQLCAGYSIQQDASRYVSLDEATSLAAQAFAAWSSASCSGQTHPSIQAMNNGPAACNSVQYNQYQPNQNVIIFRDDGWPSEYDSSWLALTTVEFYINNDAPDDPRNGQILGADMEINETDFRLVADAGAADAGSDGVDTYPLLPVLMHEAGHFLGLAHSADTSALMYALYRPSSAAGLTEDDREGICSTAVPGGLRLTTNAGVVDAGSTCDPTPTNGFQSECGDPDAAALEGYGEAGEFDSDGTPAVVTAQNGGGCSASAAVPPAYSPNPGVLFFFGLALTRRRVAAR
jgi:hypothetical protein